MTVLFMQGDKVFWDSLVFDGIGEKDVVEATAAFGTVDIAARGRRPVPRVRTAGISRTACTTPTGAG
ncbi:hypothetical protein [Streptomyces sp. NPDC047042]|uniref:hypothetical protein n=1 Tax=Streptomyces sp. NPDC047042 TaxID=3154807 RepID=UPI0033D6F538